MAVQSPARLRGKYEEPTASVRYDDTSVRRIPFRDLRLADFTWSVPWRRFRSVHAPGAPLMRAMGLHPDQRAEAQRILKELAACIPGQAPEELLRQAWKQKIPKSRLRKLTGLDDVAIGRILGL
ncbi:hypothetical protein [Kitasatospora sp. GP82]|uniref:hypothetical protein n=1 Tax=Kitasatospora sp. GP82 TaxID=3035089 RepID=UPI0024730373|nr:hypothetical protein [Kitasatospora sp. GP82]MDH6130355.1 hypothetical protein [Kitasatospora sp. GP82]